MLARAAFDPTQSPPVRLNVPAALYDQIVEHLRAALPNEGCGLLAISDEDAQSVAWFYPGENVDASPYRFTMKPETVMAAFKEMEAQGWRLGAIIHSHPRTEATPSATDLRESLYPSALVCICSFANERAVIRAWAIEKDETGRVTNVAEHPFIRGAANEDSGSNAGRGDRG